MINILEISKKYINILSEITILSFKLRKLKEIIDKLISLDLNRYKKIQDCINQAKDNLYQAEFEIKKIIKKNGK